MPDDPVVGERQVMRRRGMVRASLAQYTTRDDIAQPASALREIRTGAIRLLASGSTTAATIATGDSCRRPCSTSPAEGRADVSLHLQVDGDPSSRPLQLERNAVGPQRVIHSDEHEGRAALVE